jgi:hypothetical protein
MVYPLQVLPIGTTTYSIPPRAVTPGNRLVIVGLVAEHVIHNAAPGSVFVTGGFSCVPITVEGISLSVRPDNPIVLIGKKQQFTATAKSYYDGTTQDLTASVTWSSSNTAVATISNEAGYEGIAESISSGTTTITATYESISDSTTMTVPHGTLRYSGTTENLYGVAASVSQVVVVGMNGTIVTSSDAVTWTVRTSGTKEHLYGVVWADTQFVAVGNPDTVLTSSDGITWSLHTTGTNTGLRDIAWSGTQYVAVGGGGIITSPDCVSWTTRISLLQFWSRLASSGTMFVAVGAVGATSSPDGVTWTAVDSTHGLNSIVWTGTQFVAVGDGGAVHTSSDGTTWKKQHLSGVQRLDAVAWSGQNYVSVGSRTYDYHRIILFSNDGITWTQHRSDSNILNDIDWFDTQFVAVGSNGTIITIPDPVPVNPQMEMLNMGLSVRKSLPIAGVLSVFREALQ